MGPGTGTMHEVCVLSFAPPPHVKRECPVENDSVKRLFFEGRAGMVPGVCSHQDEQTVPLLVLKGVKCPFLKTSLGGLSAIICPSPCYLIAIPDVLRILVGLG